jgi:hypothetical protein
MSARLRAERKAGEIVKQMAQSGERPSGGRPEKQSHDATASEPTLATLGVSKTQSSRWQVLADIPEEEVAPLRLAQDTTTEYNGAVTDIPDNVDLQC